MSVPLGDAGTAFRATHVRQKMPQPLNIPMSVSELEELFGVFASQLTLSGLEGHLRYVHAFKFENVLFYAMVADNHLITLGIEPIDWFTIPGDVADRLERFLTENDLQLIHWRSRTRFESATAATNYLRGKGS